MPDRKQNESIGDTAQVRQIVEAVVEQVLASRAALEPKRDTTFHLSGPGKLLGTVLTAVIVGLLAWSANTTSQTAKDVAVLKYQFSEVQVDLKNAGSDRYTATQGLQHEREMERRVSRLEAHHGLAN